MRLFQKTAFIRFWVLSAILVILASCETVSEPRSKRFGNVVDRYVDAIEKGIKKDPENIPLHFELGSIYFRLRELSEAEKIYSKVLKFKSATWQDKSVASVRLAKIEELRKNPKKAEKWYRKGMEYEEEKGTFVIGNLGLLLENQKKYDDAFKLYVGVLERRNLSLREKDEFMMRVKALRLLYNMKTGF